MRLKYGHGKITMTLTETMYPNRIAFLTGKKRTCSAEVGALAPVFKKSATELKHKQKLVKYCYLYCVLLHLTLEL